MALLRVVLVTVFVAWIATTSAEDAGTSSEEAEKEVLEGFEKSLPGQTDLQITPLRYIGCDGTSWSCEDCNTKKLCVQFWWNTVVTYFQCPVWVPYCVNSGGSVSCTGSPPAGCDGGNSTSK